MAGQEDEVKGVGGGQEKASGARVIEQRLGEMQAAQEQMMAVMDQLQGGCIYCGLIHGGDSEPHTYEGCVKAEAYRCGIKEYEGWRDGIDMGQSPHCWQCGLTQKICRRLDGGGICEYPGVMLPGLFVLYQRQHLQGIVEAAGFQGDYEEDVWEWLKGVGEGFGSEWESNWMGTWRMVCRIYQMMKEDGEGQTLG